MCIICRGEDLTNISYLYCKCNDLTYLPSLPEGILEINCLGCKNLKKIENLPQSLRILNVYSCFNLTYLPELPEGILEINCSFLKKLPVLPNSLQTLRCYYCNSLTSLPTLPNNLGSLSCSHCHNLTSLPTLPNNLGSLSCSHCHNLTILPTLPDSLVFLDCSHCHNLTTLPTLPDSLVFLDCKCCKHLLSLPTLPDNTRIQCEYCDLLLSENLDILLQIDLEKNRERRNIISRLQEYINKNEEEIWLIFNKGMKKNNSCLNYCCNDILGVIKHNYYLDNTYLEKYREKINKELNYSNIDIYLLFE